MGISYKSLLPKAMRDTRWGQFIDAFQSVIDDIVLNKVQIIKTRFQYNKMTKTELLDMASKFGYTITTSDGYTSTITYFVKEVLSLISRIYTKTTRPCYQYIYKIFNLTGETYPIFYGIVGSVYNFIVQDNYWTTTIPRITSYVFDYNPPYKLDSGISLDSSQASTNIPIRHYVLSYYNNFIEDSTQMLSVNTLQAFYNDVNAVKRITEVPYFEPIIKVSLPSGSVNQVTTTTLQDYNLISYNNQKSVLFKNNLSGIATIQLGNSGYVNPLSASGGVQSLKYIITNNTSGVQNIEASSSVKFHSRKLVTQNFRFLDNNSGQLYFSEIALLNTSGQCIVYSTFPKIQWYPFMFQNISMDIKLI